MYELPGTPIQADNETLQALQEFGRPQDLGVEYARYIREHWYVHHFLNQKNKIIIIANDNNSSYTAEIITLDHTVKHG